MSSSPSDLGGFKEIIFGVTGTDVYKRLKYESGVHRVQRVPATEAQGRIHTSTCTVAVLPEAEEVDIEIKNEDLDIMRLPRLRQGRPGREHDGFRGADCAQAERADGVLRRRAFAAQEQGPAMTVLRSRLLEKKIAEENAKYAAQRKEQVGTGERNERIRTYNFPQNRVTDHRIELTLYNLPAFMEGDIDPIIEPLMANDLEEKMAALEL